MKPANVWYYYEKNPKDPGSAKCLQCSRIYSCKTTTSNLKKHLMYKHFETYNQLLSTDAKKYQYKEGVAPKLENPSSSDEQEDEEPTFSEPDNNSSDYEPSPPSPEPKKRKQELKEEHPDTSTPKIQSRFQNNTVVKISREFKQNSPSLIIPGGLKQQQKKLIDKRLLQMIILDYQPFSIVEEPGFRNLVRAMNPNYELPDRKLISGTLIPEKYAECKALVMDLVQKSQNVCLTMDCWTSSALDSYVAVTAHFTLDFQTQTVLLRCEQFSETDAAGALASILASIVQEYNIENKITLAVSDNIHIKKAIEEFHWPFFCCFLHKINLVIMDAIPKIGFIIETVKKVVFHFKNNSSAAEALLNYQNDGEENSLALQLIQYDPTRWNTVFYMLQRFLQLQHALEFLIPKLGVELSGLSSEVWYAVQQICLILRPFEEATSAMSGSQYLSASLAIVIVDGLKNVINLMQEKPILGVAKHFLNFLEEALKKHFPNREIEDKMLLGVCTFLDPRFKIHAFLDYTTNRSTSDRKSQRTRRAQLIKDHVLELVKYKIREKPLAATTPAKDPLSTTNKQEPEPISIWGKIDKNIAGMTASYDDIAMKAHTEMEMFLNEEVLARDACPLTWWQNHALLYPNLVEIYIQHSHIVVTSVRCDRAFSKAGSTLTNKRGRLSRKLTSELVFLHSNSHLLEYLG